MQSACNMARLSWWRMAALLAFASRRTPTFEPLLEIYAVNGF